MHKPQGCISATEVIIMKQSNRFIRIRRCKAWSVPSRTRLDIAYGRFFIITKWWGKCITFNYYLRKSMCRKILCTRLRGKIVNRRGCKKSLLKVYFRWWLMKQSQVHYTILKSDDCSEIMSFGDTEAEIPASSVLLKAVGKKSYSLPKLRNRDGSVSIVKN